MNFLLFKNIFTLCLCFSLTFISTIAIFELTANSKISNYKVEETSIATHDLDRQEDSNTILISTANESKLYPITKGTSDRYNLLLGESQERSRHGVRIYCPVSHFAHDDPIVFPNQPGKSHLHMFIANTGADAASTPESLLNSGNSSCEGGINTRSSYWVPALFNDKDEVVIPESVVIYYKSFGIPNDNYQNLQVIPNGMQMLATKTTFNAKNRNLLIQSKPKKGKLELAIYFPSCFATENGQWDGKPILSYQDMPGASAQIINSHVAYPGRSRNRQNFLGCPTSHPYRAPTMSLHLDYDREIVGENWYLASDIDKKSPGSTMHADYIATWDSEIMSKITQCNRESRSCRFDGGQRQLSDRLKQPDGNPMYKYSNILEEDADRTPFGNKLTPFQIN